MLEGLAGVLPGKPPIEAGYGAKGVLEGRELAIHVGPEVCVALMCKKLLHPDKRPGQPRFACRPVVPCHGGTVQQGASARYTGGHED